jgi:hypothetical protein
MITCFIRGGIGNQLFQIFATIACAYDNNTNFIFPEKKAPKDKRSATYWDSFLKQLYINGNVVDIYSNNFKYSILNESGYNYNKIVIPHLLLKSKVCTLLYGYYQSYKYFDKYCRRIITYIKLDERIKEVKDKFYTYYQNKYKNNCIISMHFRLGDYKTLQDCYELLNKEYYMNSIKFILDKLKTQKSVADKKHQNNNSINSYTVLYFCEDDDYQDVEEIISAIKEEFPLIIFERAGENNEKIEDWQQVLLMSCCQHNIIANSTFSWWGAYLNMNPKKIVCYPYKWFGNKLQGNNTIDLCPDTWSKINY